MRIAFTTLGCKINQFETDVMRQDLQSRGNTVVPFDEEADVYIINTCSVTAKSDYQSRQTIRSAIRRCGGAKVVVTGCYAETQPEELRNIPGVHLIFGNHEKAVIADQLMLKATAAAVPGISPDQKMSAAALHGRTRGFLKIQDGCNNRCSYCIVPIARGASRSVLPRDVMNEFEHMVESGYPEVVLSGIHIGSYGTDLGTGITITEMVKMLLSARGQARIRLSSIEPREITDELISFIGNGLCRHLHIPLQSGDDAILSCMNRTYTSGFYSDLLEKISKRVPGIALGADVMVGFPGEGDSEFQNTLSLVEQSPLTHLHVFSYSPRPGTPAANMKTQVSEQVKRKRSELLRNIGKIKNYKFRKKNLECEQTVIVESKVDATTGLHTGLSDNYIRSHIIGSKKDHIGKEIKVRISEVTEHATVANICN